MIESTSMRFFGWESANPRNFSSVKKKYREFRCSKHLGVAIFDSAVATVGLEPGHLKKGWFFFKVQFFNCHRTNVENDNNQVAKLFCLRKSMCKSTLDFASVYRNDQKELPATHFKIPAA